MLLPDLFRMAGPFAEKLIKLKASRPDIPWYPFNSLDNFHWFDEFTAAGREVLSVIDPGVAIADIGAADGDIAFFLESLGASVTIIDNISTNANNCRGILEMHSILNSNVGVQLNDLDWTPWLSARYDLVFFLGILYHVRNPALILNTLAHATPRLLLSTKVFFRLDDGTNVDKQQLSYFADRREIYNDPTIYWLFTPEALRVLLRRSGWQVLDEFFTGDASIATPREGNSRMFCYCERVPNWQHLRAHHDF